MRKNAASEERLLQKIQSLPPAKVAEVEDFIDFLLQRYDRRLTWAASKLSEGAFSKVWDKPEDAAYDRLASRPRRSRSLSLRPQVGRLASILLCVGPLGSPSTAVAATLPNITLRVTVQQKEGGTISPGLHIMTLRCYGGSCELESVSLNQCDESPMSGTQSFPVIVQRSSTNDESLRVVDHGGTLAVEERGSDMGGSYVNNYRFGYKRSPDRLVSFSGAFVKDSAILGKVITVEYVPLNGAYSERTLSCAVRLPGVSLSK